MKPRKSFAFTEATPMYSSRHPQKRYWTSELLSLKIRTFKPVYNDCLITVGPAERDIYLPEAPLHLYIGVTKPEYSLYFHALYWRNERRSPSEYLVSEYSTKMFVKTFLQRPLLSNKFRYSFLCYFFRVKYHVSHPWEATGKIISLINSPFYVVRPEDKRHWFVYQLLISSC
jgi:hypothetical protein